MSRTRRKNKIILGCFITAIAVANVQALASDTTTSMMMDHMRFLNARDEALSNNIANSDTPKYLPMDIQKRKSHIHDVEMITTNPMHIDISDSQQYTRVKAPIDEIKPNGNAVSLEQEMLKKSDNAMEFQQAVNLYNKMRVMLNGAVTMGAGQ